MPCLRRSDTANREVQRRLRPAAPSTRGRLPSVINLSQLHDAASARLKGNTMSCSIGACSAPSGTPISVRRAAARHRDVFYNRYNTGKPALVIVGGAIGGAMFFAGAQRVVTIHVCWMQCGACHRRHLWPRWQLPLAATLSMQTKCVLDGASCRRRCKRCFASMS